MIRQHARILLSLLVAFWLGSPAMAGKPKLPTVDSLVEKAQAAVASGNVEPARDLAPLLERLAVATDSSDQGSLLYVIERLGRHDSANPAAVKAYLRENAPPVLLAIARGKASGSVRGDALLLLRTLNVDDRVLDEAIAIANADTSADQRSIRFHGTLLANWRASHPAVEPVVEKAGSGGPGGPDRAREQAALEQLRRRGVRVSTQSLSEAAMHAETETLIALLDAGIDPNSPGVIGPALAAAVSTCEAIPVPVAVRLATVAALLDHGADVKYQDNGGNSILMSAVTCPPEVVARLISAGAPVHTANNNQFTPLHHAFMRGQWQVAELLIENGARISKSSVEKLFFEMPTDPAKLAVLKRATGEK